jgi:DNA-binding response OmpR family regulator
MAVMTANNQQTVLVVEDDPSLQSLITEILELEGYQVVTADKGKKALKLFNDSLPDLVLLDLTLPDMDGMDVCRKIRSESNTPVIMVTGRDAADERVAGLYSGADDYIIKPFYCSELIARVVAVLRRHNGNRETGPESLLQFQDLKINLVWNMVTIGDTKIDLNDSEYRILVALARRVGETLTPEQLIQEIWGEGADQSINNLRVSINRLRHKLSIRSVKINYIKTVSGLGYTFKPFSSGLPSVSKIE